MKEWRVGYLGPEGTYSHGMAIQVFPESRLIPYFSIEDVLEAVDSGEIDEAMVPIENSTEGAVLVTLDILAHEVDLKIVGEYLLPIRHYLWALQGTGEISRIISHSQALGQCRKFIKSHYPKAEIIPVASSAGAVQGLIDGDKFTGAIGGIRAGKDQDGLEVICEDIQDNPNNCTRFVRVRKVGVVDSNSKNMKSSFVCKINGEKAGSLQELLGEISQRGINMTRIESRPTGNKMGEYYFFIDIAFDSGSLDWEDALEAIEKSSLWYKNLGTYPQREE